MQEHRYEQDFDEIIRKELQLQGYQQDPAKNFDYLTNPGGLPQEEEEEPFQEEPQQE